MASSKGHGQMSFFCGYAFLFLYITYPTKAAAEVSTAAAIQIYATIPCLSRSIFSNTSFYTVSRTLHVDVFKPAYLQKSRMRFLVKIEK